MTGSANRIIGAKELAVLLGRSRRAIEIGLARCIGGRTWLGQQLPVFQVRSRGGRGGYSYAVLLSDLPIEWQERYWAPTGSLPEDLQRRLRGQQEAPGTGSEAPLSPTSKPLSERIADRSIDPLQLRPEPHRSPSESDWTRTRVVEEITAATERGTHERAAMIDSVSKAEGFSPRTVREWVRMAEGGKSVIRRVRSDSGNPRAILSRPLDAALRRVGQTEEQILSYRDQEVLPRVRHAYASRLRTSAQSIIYDLQPDIMEHLRTVGVTLPAAQLRRLSLLPRAFVERCSSYKAIATERLDKHQYYSKMRPDCRRDCTGLRPMQLVSCDVHPIDTYVTRPDGSKSTPKMVAFQDIATRRVFVRAFLLPLNTGIRKEHVAETFIQMAADPAFGIPEEIYTDNGKEFKNKLLNFIAETIGAIGCADRCKVRRAGPYNGKAKFIETFFSQFENENARVPGYSGSDRMKKKTENQGNAPSVFPGPFEVYEAILQNEIIHGYHHTPQARGSHLKGKTPAEAFAAFISGEQPWQACVVDETIARFKLGEIKKVRAQAGGSFAVEGRTYRSDAVLSLAGHGHVFVRLPVYGPRDDLPLYELDESGRERYLGLAHEVRPTAHDDRGAAVERQRQEQELRRQLRAKAAALEPVIRLGDRARAYADLPEPTATSVVPFDPESQKFVREIKSRLRTGAPAPAAPSAEEAARQEKQRHRDELFDRALAAMK